jgi:hypothetical protein
MHLKYVVRASAVDVHLHRPMPAIAGGDGVSLRAF